jgi:opacity protein-like surface antigen
MRSYLRAGGFVVVVGACLILPGTAAAQSVIEPRTWTATPFLSASFGTSNDLGGSIGLGVAIGYDLTARLGFEGEIAHVFDLLGDDANVDWSLTNVSGNAVYHFDVPRITPYATFGLGFERSSPRIEVPDILALYPGPSTEIAYNFGGGVKYPINDRFIARADLRRFHANDLAPDHWRLYGGLTFWIAR